MEVVIQSLPTKLQGTYPIRRGWGVGVRLLL